mgnify:CR=1 FL=1
MILPIYLYGSDVLRRENVDVDLNDKEGIAKLIGNVKSPTSNSVEHVFFANSALTDKIFSALINVMV